LLQEQFGQTRALSRGDAAPSCRCALRAVQWADPCDQLFPWIESGGTALSAGAASHEQQPTQITALNAVFDTTTPPLHERP